MSTGGRQVVNYRQNWSTQLKNGPLAATSTTTVKLGNKELFGHPKIVP